MKGINLNLDKYKQNPNESTDEYYIRICSYKYSDQLTWENIKNIINYQCSQYYSADYYRKRYSKFRNEQASYDFADDEIIETTNDDNKLTELKDKVAQSDLFVQTNALIRRLSREDTFKEIGKAAAQIVSEKVPLLNNNQYYYPSESKSYKKVGILQISDWHYGIEINKSPFNVYNPEIAKTRIIELENQVLNIIKEQNISKLIVANLGDMIAGRIHLPIRLNSRIDVIDQTIQVSELIAEFLHDIYKQSLTPIDYYSVIDNHSRLDPNKKEALQTESLARITDWYLKERLKNCYKITINDNFYGDDILTFDVFNYSFAGVHGDLDKFDKVVDNISMFTQKSYDVVLSSHLHHFAVDEMHKTFVISNPSMMGTDDLAVKLRKNSYAAQNLIIVTPENPVYSIYRLVL